MKATDIRQGQTWYMPMMDFNSEGCTYFVGRFFVAPDSWPSAPTGVVPQYHRKGRFTGHLQKCKTAGINPTMFKTRRQAERWIKLRGYKLCQN